MKFGSAPIVGALSLSVAGGTPLISGVEARRQPNTEKGLRPLDYLQTSHEAVQALGVSPKRTSGRYETGTTTLSQAMGKIRRN